MGGGYFYRTLNKDISEINKVFISLFGVGIILIAIFLGMSITKSSYALFTDTIIGEKTIEVEVDTLINKTTVFNYTGSSQEYEVPKDGYYYIEMAGGQGGDGDIYLSRGSLVKGYIYLEQGEMLYIYVGKRGTNRDTNCRSTGYEFNGGGIAKPARSGICGATGGGATDVRLVGGDWDDTNSLISRIMVAGGGGGYVLSPSFTSGNGGTLYGEDPIFSTYQSYLGNGGTQTFGGQAPTKFSSAQSNGTVGSFGKGGYGGANASTASTGGGAGGGSGYYGGSGASGMSSGSWPGGGGSSYISGYAGVNSVEESTTIKHTNQTLHYSGKYFIGGKMLAGQNEGNGYAKITYVRKKPKRKTTKLDNVRYIKNCTSYNTDNNGNHWIEVQAIKDGVNVAKGKTVTGTTTQNSSYPYSRITDGDIIYTNYARPTSYSANQCITVDLGATYDLDEVAIWNYFGDQRRYYDNVTSVSNDNKNFIEVIDEASIETSNGHRINAYTDTYNGYVQDGLVLWYDGYANTGTTRNHTTTSWKDLSGTGNNGTLVGGTWYNNYLSFDGTNDYVLFVNPLYTIVGAAPDITVEISFLKTLDKYGGIINLSHDVNDKAHMSIWSFVSSAYPTYNFYIIFDEILTGDRSFYRFDRKKYPSNIFYNISYGQKDDSYFAYDNANLIYESSKLSTPVGWLRNTGYLGKASDNTQVYYFAGNIRYLRIYNRGLTEEEILHNYNYDKERFNIR